MSRIFCALALFAALAGMGLAQNPVKWSMSVEPAAAAPGSKILARASATIEPGWHLYGLSTPPPSPATRLKLADKALYTPGAVYYREPKRVFDKNFNIETQSYEEKAEFLLDATLKSDAPAGPGELAAELRYNVCDATRCLPPKKLTLTAALTIDPKAAASLAAIPAGFLEYKPGAPAPPPSAAPAAPQDIAPFLALAFGAGLLAIFTPC